MHAAEPPCVDSVQVTAIPTPSNGLNNQRVLIVSLMVRDSFDRHFYAIIPKKMVQTGCLASGGGIIASDHLTAIQLYGIV